VLSTEQHTEERDLERLEAALIEPHSSYPQFDRTAEREAIAQAASEGLLT